MAGETLDDTVVSNLRPLTLVSMKKWLCHRSLNHRYHTGRDL